MTKRDEVWDLLVRHAGEWLTRADIEEVGGAEAMRRLREVRTASLASDFTLEQRQTIGNLLEYRLVKREVGRRETWACTKCGMTQPVADLQPSTDSRDRYRLGRCAICKKSNSVFRKETP